MIWGTTSVESAISVLVYFSVKRYALDIIVHLFLKHKIDGGIQTKSTKVPLVAERDQIIDLGVP